MCGEEGVDQPYHYWRGASGRRYLHTVYSLVECPALPKANYILVHRAEDGSRRPLEIGQTRTDTHTLNLAHLRFTGARLGANEVHIHLLAESARERARVEADLSARQLGRSRSGQKLAAANDILAAAC
ncbi:MAG: hypothetical protein Kow0032_22480 [Methyloligellaceae bacterium]